MVNADYANFETKVLEPRYRTYDANYWNKCMFTPSALIAYVGVDKKSKTLFRTTSSSKKTGAKTSIKYSIHDMQNGLNMLPTMCMFHRR